MGSCYWSEPDEKRSSGFVNAMCRSIAWNVLLNSLSAVPPCYAYGINATASFQGWVSLAIINNGLEIIDSNTLGASEGEARNILAESGKIKAKTWTSLSVNLVEKGRVPRTFVPSSGSIFFTPNYEYLTFKVYYGNSLSSESFRISSRRVDISWSDPSLIISTPSVTGGSVSFTNNSATTADYSGNQRYTIPFHGNVCNFTLTAVPQSGYHFLYWSDDTNNTSTTRTLSLTDSDLTGVSTTKTYTPVFEKITYYLDLNGMLDGVSSGSLSNEDGIPYGTADIYINGSLVSQSVDDYYAAHDSGSTYEIKNIKANDGYRYDGVYSGSLSGTLTTATQVVLSFSTKPTYTITYNINAPTNAYTSGTVEAQTCDNGDSVTIRENNFKVSRSVFFVPNRYEDEDIAATDTKTSYAPFLGWFTEATGGTQVSGDYTPMGDIILYAHWGDFPLITPVTYINEGYAIEGWYTDASGGTKILESTEQYYPTNEYLYVYAHWIVTGIYIGTSILDVYIGNKKWDVYQGTTKIYG